jgi:hypothetical protein
MRPFVTTKGIVFTLLCQGYPRRRGGRMREKPREHPERGREGNSPPGTYLRKNRDFSGNQPQDAVVSQKSSGFFYKILRAIVVVQQGKLCYNDCN